MKRIGVVIPARYGSRRFPGKPLALVAGVSILERSYRIARAAQGIAWVGVATDDARIAAHAESFFAPVVMTAAALPTGSDRTAAAVTALAEQGIALDAVINLQGDALLTPPWVLDALAAALTDGASFATPAVALDAAQLAHFLDAKKTQPASGTTVVFDDAHRALYFSKHVLPFAGGSQRQVHRHIGVYAYSKDALAQYAALPPSTLERAEGLEQLRALQAGIPITVVPVDYRGRTHWSVDHKDDIAHAEAIIAREGELG